MWAIGFVTGTGPPPPKEALGSRHVSISVSPSRTPMTGETVFLPAEKLVSLRIGVDEAVRVVVSAGAVVLPSERVEGLSESLVTLGPKLDAGGA